MLDRIAVPSETAFDRATELHRILANHLTSSSEVADPKARYKELRGLLLTDPIASANLPPIVRACDDLDECWKVVTASHNTYKERRAYLWTQFEPYLSDLSTLTKEPIDELVARALQSPHFEGVRAVWARALERRHEDPEGAITLARTLLESTCKHILDAQGISYEQDADLPKLYRQVATSMSLAPDQHQEEAFRRILGGAQSIVEGLGSVRNKLSDAHGKGPKAVRPSPRHAALAVNSAGAIAQFLIATYQERHPAA